jgi:cation:H+ antiporter
VRQGKEKLALANISGSMMIQATVPSGLGLLFTPWRFDAPLMIASGITLMAIGILYTLFRRGRVSGVTLMPMAGMYALFAAILLMY